MKKIYIAALIGGGILILFIGMFALMTRNKKNASIPDKNIKPTTAVSFSKQFGARSAVPTEVPFTKELQAQQEQADREFGLRQQTIDENYPWINKFPLNEKDFFVYFDINDKSFYATLYSDPQNAENVKKTIVQKITDLGIESTKYPIIYTQEETPHDE